MLKLIDFADASANREPPAEVLRKAIRDALEPGLSVDAMRGILSKALGYTAGRE